MQDLITVSFELFIGSTEAAVTMSQSQDSGVIGNFANLPLVSSEIADAPHPHQRYAAANEPNGPEGVERVSENTGTQWRRGWEGEGGAESISVGGQKMAETDCLHHHSGVCDNRKNFELHVETPCEHFHTVLAPETELDAHHPRQDEPDPHPQVCDAL